MYKPLSLALVALVLMVPAPLLARDHFDTPYLSCVAAYPVVSVGNAGRFTVVSNVPGPFMWTTSEFGVVDAGEVFVVPFEHVGSEQVVVVWGSRRASCFVEVVGVPGYGEPYLGPAPVQPGFFDALNVTLSSVFYPRLPNAGFGPQSAAAFAFAVVLLLGSGIALYPHAKKAFIVALR